MIPRTYSPKKNDNKCIFFLPQIAVGPKIVNNRPEEQQR